MRHAMRFGLLGLLAIGLLLNDSMFAQESMCWSLTGYVNNNTNIGYYYPYDELKGSSWNLVAGNRRH